MPNGKPHDHPQPKPKLPDWTDRMMSGHTLRCTFLDAQAEGMWATPADPVASSPISTCGHPPNSPSFMGPCQTSHYAGGSLCSTDPMPPCCFPAYD